MSIDHPTVEYRALPDYPGYFIGSDGTVWTSKKRGGPKQWYISTELRQMKPTVSKVGYLRVSLPSKPNKILVSVHRLVLLTFVGPCPEGFQARHLNGNQLDNRLENLAWGTVQENHDDKKLHGTTARGETSGRSKLTEKLVRSIRQDALNGAHLKTLNLKYGVSDVTIYHIINRHTWKHIA